MILFPILSALLYMIQVHTNYIKPREMNSDDAKEFLDSIDVNDDDLVQDIVYFINSLKKVLFAFISIWIMFLILNIIEMDSGLNLFLFIVYYLHALFYQALKNTLHKFEQLTGEKL